MSRQGALPGELGRLLGLALGPLCDALELRGLMTHFARADESDPAPTRAQLQLFLETLAGLPPLPSGVLRHAANSAGVLAHPAAHMEACRPGIAVYGLSPGPAAGDAAGRLRPVLRLESRVTLLKRVPRGTAVSYGGAFVTHRPCTTLAVVAAGYGDGLARAQSGRMAALLAGVRCPQLGRVTMDQMVVDATEVPAQQLKLGMPVSRGQFGVLSC
jgi:alanine racemase